MASLFKLCCGCCSKDKYWVESTEEGKLKEDYKNNVAMFKDKGTDQSVIKLRKSNYTSLKKKHKEGSLFTDPQFPPGPKSLGSIPNVPQDCEWKRLSEIIENPQLFVDGVEPTDVVSGSLGDCYFLSAVAAIAENQRRILKIFGDQEYNKGGIYKIPIRIDGVVEQVVIDDYVPVNKAGKPLFCQPNSNEIWVVLLEKAWAKANGSYANISIGTPTEVFKALTYAPSELRPIKFSTKVKNQIWEDIKYAAEKKHLICASTIRDSGTNISSMGLDPGHGYTILNATELEDNDGDVFRVMKLRNPWGKKQWKGVASENDSNFWSNIPQNQKRLRFFDGMQKQNDGIFTMRFEDFSDYFNEVNLCYLVNNPKYESEKMKCDKKHGTVYELTIHSSDDYCIELHQSNQQKDKTKKYENFDNVWRSTLLLAKADDYQFIDGSLKYQEEDNILKTNLSPGKYLIYAKLDPSPNNTKVPDEISISCYSGTLVDIEKKHKDKDFFNKVFLSYGRQNPRKTMDDGKMWISWNLFFQKGGFAYIAFGAKEDASKKFKISFDEKDFNEMGYILKKPYKGKGKQEIEIKPGEQKVIVARVKNGPIQAMKFPPQFNIQTEDA